MKRSKIFLGITSCILAGVAFAAAKTAKFSALRAGYYTGAQHRCTAAAGISGFTQFVAASGNDQLLLKGVRQVYSYNAGACAKILYTQNPVD